MNNRTLDVDLSEEDTEAPASHPDGHGFGESDGLNEADLEPDDSQHHKFPEPHDAINHGNEDEPDEEIGSSRSKKPLIIIGTVALTITGGLLVLQHMKNGAHHVPISSSQAAAMMGTKTRGSNDLGTPIQPPASSNAGQSTGHPIVPQGATQNQMPGHGLPTVPQQGVQVGRAAPENLSQLSPQSGANGGMRPTVSGQHTTLAMPEVAHQPAQMSHANTIPMPGNGSDLHHPPSPAVMPQGNQKATSPAVSTLDAGSLHKIIAAIKAEDAKIKTEGTQIKGQISSETNSASQEIAALNTEVEGLEKKITRLSTEVASLKKAGTLPLPPPIVKAPAPAPHKAPKVAHKDAKAKTTVEHDPNRILHGWVLSGVSRTEARIISPYGKAFTVWPGEGFHGLGKIGKIEPYKTPAGVASYQLMTSGGRILPKIGG